MSDQEKKKTGGAAAGGSPVVVVEQSTASRHKQPYRPTDLQNEAPQDPHHKRSRAPAVPTAVAEEFKDTVETTDIKGKEVDHVSSEKHKHIVAKKLSSTTKRRETSPGPNTAQPKAPPIELELKKTGNIVPTVTVLPAQPVPAQPMPMQPDKPIPPPKDPMTSAAFEMADKSEADRKSDEDSITEEIAELRTPEHLKKSGEWDNGNCYQKYVPEISEIDDAVPLKRKLANAIIVETNSKTEHKDLAVKEQVAEDTVPLQRKLGSEIINDSITSSHQLKKKEISWSDATYLDKVPLENLSARSASWMLERKTSVGPCYRKTMPYGEPSGITICLPKKSFKSLNEIVNPNTSGISITVSKRSIDGKSSSPIDEVNTNGRHNMITKEKKVELKIEEDHYVNFFENLKGKVDNLCDKIKHVMHL